MVLEVPNSQTWPFGPSSGFVVVNDGIVNLLATIFKIIYLFKAIILQVKKKKDWLPLQGAQIPSLVVELRFHMPKWCEGDEGCREVGTQRVSHVSGRGENKDMASTGQLGEVFFKTCVTQQVQRGSSVFRNKSL